MAYNKNVQDVVDAYTASSDRSENFGILRRAMLASSPSEFATEAAAGTLSNWLDQITGAVAPQIYPLPLVVNQEDNSEGPTVETVSRLEQIFIANGLVVFVLRLTGKTALGVYQQISKFNGTLPYLYAAMEGGHILAYSQDTTKFKAVPLGQFSAEKKWGDPATDDHILVTLGIDPKFFNDQSVWIKPATFDPVVELEGIKPVDLEIVSQSTSEVIFQISGAHDSQPIVGDAEDGDLAQTDFTFSSTFDGELTSVTNNQDGTYTCTPTAAFSAGATTIDLNAPSATSQRYAQVAQLAFTIS